MISEERRRELHEALRRQLGDGPAGTLMTQLIVMDPDHFAARDEVAALRGDLGQLRTELRGEIAELRTDITDLRGEHRSDIAQMRLEMARQTRQLTLVIFAQFAATVGVVLSVA